MKKQTLLLLTLFATVLFSACEKDCPEPITPLYSMQGLWLGTYTTNSPAGNQFMSVSFKPDGTIILETRNNNVQHIGTGTWVVNNETDLVFSSTVVVAPSSALGAKYEYSAKFDKKTGLVSAGTFKSIPPTAPEQGTFVLTAVVRL